MSGKVTSTVPLLSRFRLTGYCSIQAFLSVSLDTQLLLDLVHQPGSRLMVFSVHWKHRNPASTPHPQMTTPARGESASRGFKVTLELSTGHLLNDTTKLLYIQQIGCV